MSDPVLLQEDYTLLIDTDSNAYEFEKELTAYCTGLCDEAGAGADFGDLFYRDLGIDDDESSIALQQNPFLGVIQDVDTESGMSPCSVWANPSYGLNEDGESALLSEDNYIYYTEPAPFSVGINFKNLPGQYLTDLVRQRARAFFDEIWPKVSKKSVRMDGVRLVKHTRYAEEITL